MKSTLNSPVIQMGLGLLAIGCIYYIAEASAPAFKNLPISGISSAQAPHSADSAALANLYPLVAKAPPKPSPSQTADDIIPVDEIFIPKGNTKDASANASPDYFTLLNTKNLLVLQATTNDGAIISKQFYSYDSSLSEWEYPGPDGRKAAPRLKKGSTPNTVRILESPGTRQFVLSMGTD